MIISEQWLRTWVNPNATTEALSHKLTMIGLEVDSIDAAAEAFSGVVVAEIISAGSIPMPTSYAYVRSMQVMKQSKLSAVHRMPAPDLLHHWRVLVPSYLVASKSRKRSCAALSLRACCVQARNSRFPR